MDDLESYYADYWSESGFLPRAPIPAETAELIAAALEGVTVCVDFGCGDGHAYGRWVADQVDTYIGFDVSEVAVAEAQGLGLDARLLDGSRIPLEDGSVDLVFSIEVLEHLFSPRAALEEARRVLRPGGRLLVTVPNVAYWRRRLDLAVFGRWNPLGDDRSVEEPWRDPHIRFFNIGSLTRLLTLTGFEQISVGGHFGAFLRELPVIRRFGADSGGRSYKRLERIAPALAGSRLHAFARKPERG